MLLVIYSHVQYLQKLLRWSETVHLVRKRHNAKMYKYFQLQNKKQFQGNLRIATCITQKKKNCFQLQLSGVVAPAGEKMCPFSHRASQEKL